MSASWWYQQSAVGAWGRNIDSDGEEVRAFQRNSQGGPQKLLHYAEILKGNEAV